MKNMILIYGAYGYTGELIAKLAKIKGHTPILAGRDEEKTKALANELAFEYKCFDLSESDKLQEALADVETVLHCAGPFGTTAKVMIEACIATKTNYLLESTFSVVNLDAGIYVISSEINGRITLQKFIIKH